MNKFLSTTALSKKLGMTSRELFAEFETLGWITADRNLTVEGFSVGGIYKEIKKEGETIKYIAWPDDVPIGIKPQETNLVTATQLSKTIQIPAKKINLIFSEIGWAKKGDLNIGWLATPQAISLGAVQAEDPKSGAPFIRWPDSIQKNQILFHKSC